MTQEINVTYDDHATHNGDNFFVPLSSLEQAVEQIKRTLSGNCDAVEIIENLADYIADHPSGKVIGLEQKLINGNRQDLYNRALLLKNRFERKLAKNQMSLVEQHIYVQLLSTISSIWYSKIKPLIDIGTSKQTIDKAIYDDLIEPVHKAVVRYDTLSTSEEVSGMLYFLTGKCHLVWENTTC
ncbi:TPA: ABC-three component system protein [Photobacterium damselae]